MSELYQLGRRLAEIALEGMGAHELNIAPGEFLVLQDLFLHPRSAVGDIAKRTGLAQSRVSTSVRSL
ncbi:MarR family transcriptional regulator, partial [Streptomyces milbemycinicus]